MNSASRSKLWLFCASLLVALYLLNVPAVRGQQEDQLSDAADLSEAASEEQLAVAESKGAGAGAGGAVLSKGGFKKGGAAGFKSGAKGAAGFGAKAGKKAGFAKGAAAAAGGFKKGGKKGGFASGAGYAAKFGKKGGKFGSFAAGHKKAFGTVKAFHHNSAFKFGKGGAFGAAGGASKGFAAKKGFAGAAGAAGFKKGAKGGAKGFAAAGAAKAAFKKGAAGKAAFKKGKLSSCIPKCDTCESPKLTSELFRINRRSCRWQGRRAGRQRSERRWNRQVVAGQPLASVARNKWPQTTKDRNRKSVQSVPLPSTELVRSSIIVNSSSIKKLLEPLKSSRLVYFLHLVAARLVQRQS